MVREEILERYLEALLSGDRQSAREVIEDILKTGVPANSVYAEVIWPTMVSIEKLSRANELQPVKEHLATRINRTIVDQLQNKLPRRPEKNKKIVICCAPDEQQELGAQMMVDLFESDGWETRFIGGGLVNEEILSYVHEYVPDVLLIYGTGPKQAPDIRRIIDRIRQINAWPDMRIMVSGGLFNRAEGLWEEIGADLFAETAVEAVQIAGEEKSIEPPKRTINLRKVRQQKKAAVLTTVVE